MMKRCEPLTQLNLLRVACGWLWLILLPLGLVRADSALPLLNNFPPQRIEAIFADPAAVDQGELAKLLFRVKKIDTAALNQRAGGAGAVGDVVAVRGTVVEVLPIRVADELVELLDLKVFYRLEIKDDSQTGSFWWYVLEIPKPLKSGDSVSAMGIMLKLKSETAGEVIAAATIRWTPADTDIIGWSMLARYGVDLGSVNGLAERNRQPLRPADGDAFYSMLAAARSIGNEESAGSKELTQPVRVQPLEMLQTPQKWIGQWIGVEAEIVRITRIAVPEAQRQQQLGSDAYYQIDAKAELDNVVIELQRPEGPPVRFENVYPITLVTDQLPDFLKEQMRDADGELAGVKMLTTRIEVDGFFFRLWSYETVRMNREGHGEQLGPLVIAAKIRNREISEKDPFGVAKIGYLVAFGVLSAMLMIWFWNRSNARADAAAAALRNQREQNEVRNIDQLL